MAENEEFDQICYFILETINNSLPEFVVMLRAQLVAG